MIGAMARHRVQVLWSAGLPQARIAAIEGISERSVRTICGARDALGDSPDIIDIQPAQVVVEVTDSRGLQ